MIREHDIGWSRYQKEHGDTTRDYIVAAVIFFAFLILAIVAYVLAKRWSP